LVTTARYVSIADACGIAGAAVVIDVLRAFTTAAVALDAGAKRVVLARDVAHVLELTSAIRGAIVCTDGAPRGGFDLVNSPIKVAARDVSGRVLVQLTTNGTVGALAARDASPLYCAGFATASATAAALRAGSVDDVTFVVTGRDGAADEDRACAEYIAALLDDPATASAPYCERADRSESAANLRHGAALGYEGIHPDDVDLCIVADHCDFAMRAVPFGDDLALEPGYMPRISL
jgi:2-phosphosulfolactate phosphatase